MPHFEATSPRRFVVPLANNLLFQLRSNVFSFRMCSGHFPSSYTGRPPGQESSFCSHEYTCSLTHTHTRSRSHARLLACSPVRSDKLLPTPLDLCPSLQSDKRMISFEVGDSASGSFSTTYSKKLSSGKTRHNDDNNEV